MTLEDYLRDQRERSGAVPELTALEALRVGSYLLRMRAAKAIPCPNGGQCLSPGACGIAGCVQMETSDSNQGGCDGG